MRRLLRRLALLIALGATAYWLGAGANRGWTKTSVAKKSVDEVTGIEGITYEAKFVPGVEWLGAAWAMAAVLAGVSLVLRPNSVRNAQNKI